MCWCLFPFLMDVWCLALGAGLHFAFSILIRD
jgi:hypothetical protein